MLVQAPRHREERVDVSLSDLCSFKRERRDETKTSWQEDKSKRTHRTQLQKGEAARGIPKRKRQRLLGVKGTKVTKQTVSSRGCQGWEGWEGRLLRAFRVLRRSSLHVKTNSAPPAKGLALPK